MSQNLLSAAVVIGALRVKKLLWISKTMCGSRKFRHQGARVRGVMKTTTYFTEVVIEPLASWGWEFVPVFLMKHMAICDFLGVRSWPHVPPLDPPMRFRSDRTDVLSVLIWVQTVCKGYSLKLINTLNYSFYVGTMWALTWLHAHMVHIFKKMCIKGDNTNYTFYFCYWCKWLEIRWTCIPKMVCFFNYNLPNLVKETSSALTSFVLEIFFPSTFYSWWVLIAFAMYGYATIQDSR